MRIDKPAFPDVGVLLALATAGLVVLFVESLYSQSMEMNRRFVQSDADSVKTRPTTRPTETGETRNGAVNPHWDPDKCSVCHQVTSGNAQPIAVAEADEICLRCHNGDIASREVHPVGRLVNKPGLTMPEDWPAPGNRLGCITCHNPAAEHCKGLDRPEEDPAFLRGYEGGPFTDFCARCHQRTESHRPYNPHTSQLVDGRVNEQSCLLCHQDTPDYKTAKLSDTTNLRSGPIRLCAGCHRYHVGYFQPGHINHDVSAEKRAYMVAFEQDLLPITDEKLKQMAERNPRPQRLPLSENHHIVCSTCHNPHQAGLFPRDSLLAKGAIPADNKDKNKQYRFRGLGKEICRGCHRQ